MVREILQALSRTTLVKMSIAKKRNKRMMKCEMRLQC